MAYLFSGKTTATMELPERLIENKFVKGWFHSYGVREEISVLSVGNTPDNLKKFNQIEYLSHQARCIGLLSPYAKMVSSIDNMLAIGFRASTAFHQGYGEKAFDSNESLMSPFWREQIQLLLKTIEYMHSKNVCHGHLNDDSSYRICKGNICIILPQINLGEYMDPYHLKREDLVAFGDFLERIIPCGGHKSHDFLGFISLSRMSPRMMNIRHCISHPILKDSEGRLRYWRMWYSCVRPNVNCTSNEKREEIARICRGVLLNGNNLSDDWRQNLVHGTFLHSFCFEPKKGVAAYGIHGGDLLRFVRDAVNDYVDYNIRMSEVEREISMAFPGIFDLLHQVIVDNPSYTLA